MAVFTNKKGETTSFFINLIVSDSNKNDGPGNMQRIDKFPECP